MVRTRKEMMVVLSTHLHNTLVWLWFLTHPAYRGGTGTSKVVRPLQIKDCSYMCTVGGERHRSVEHEAA